jgi:hypothetical protein
LSFRLALLLLLLLLLLLMDDMCGMMIVLRNGIDNRGWFWLGNTVGGNGLDGFALAWLLY